MVMVVKYEEMERSWSLFAGLALIVRGANEKSDAHRGGQEAFKYPFYLCQRTSHPRAPCIKEVEGWRRSYHAMRFITVSLHLKPAHSV